MSGERAAELIRDVDQAKQALAEKVATLGSAADLPAGDGWTVKEMLGHVAFWHEAAFGAISTMIRRGTLPEGWRFGSGYVPEGDWPPADVHNAREAAWAREQTFEAVVQQLGRSARCAARPARNGDRRRSGGQRGLFRRAFQPPA